MVATVQLAPVPKLRFVDTTTGLALVGGKVFTYQAGTTTKQASYTDSTGTTQNPNPVILDSRGEASIWLDQSLTYKVVLSPSTDTDPPTAPIWTIDNIPASAAGFATLATSAGGNIVGFNYAYAYVQNTLGAALQDEQVNAIWFVTSEARRQAIKNRTFANDNTAEAQAALTWAGPGRSVRFPGGWNIAGTLTRYPGQFIVGEGWQDKPGTFQLQAGSELRQQTAGIALISSSAASDAVNAARGGLKDIALTFQGGSATSTNDTTSTGFYAKNNRQLRLENVFISGFGTGYELADNCWQSRIDGVLVFDAVVCAYTHDAGGEDSTHINCIYRGYRTTSQGLHLKNQCQRVLMLGCDTSNNQLGVFMEQGDTNGDGSGLPYAMELTCVSHQFENCTAAGIRSVSSVTSNTATVIAQYPSITVIDPRAYNATNPNTGQILVDAQKASRVELSGANSSGYSTGVQIGMNGTAAQVAEVHLNNPQAVWGTAESAATGPNGLAKIYRRTGPRPSASFTSTALTTSTTVGIPFATTVSDTETWYFLNGGTSTIRPRRYVRTRFDTTLRFSTMPAGVLTIDLYKNGAKLATVWSNTVVNAAITLQASYFDTPVSGDYYYLVVTPPGSCTLDTANSTFSAESCL